MKIFVRQQIFAEVAEFQMCGPRLGLPQVESLFDVADQVIGRYGSDVEQSVQTGFETVVEQGDGACQRIGVLFAIGRLIVREMADTLSLDLVAKGVKAGRVGLMVGYDTASLDPKRLGKDGSADLKAIAEHAVATYDGPVSIDRYGRRVPKPATGSIALPEPTSATSRICDAVDKLFLSIVDRRLLVRRLNVVAADVLTAVAGKNAVAGLDAFACSDELEARSGMPVPQQVKALRSLPIRHTAHCEKGGMAQAVLDAFGGK